jgi:hypothetical protein
MREVAKPGLVAYAGSIVRPPVVNLEERIDRVVGRRTKAPDPLSVVSGSRVDAEAWRRVFGGIRVPKGVHRFHTHEEADEWLWRMIARPR